MGGAPGTRTEHVQEWFPAENVEPLGDGDYKIEFLAHGFTHDKKRYYTQAALEAAARDGVFDGVKMYSGHPTAEELRRGHRDVDKWLATIRPGTVQVVNGNLQAVCHAHETVGFLEDSFAKTQIGISHNSDIRFRPRKIDGVDTHSVEAIPRSSSVDFVPSGNAHGRVLEAEGECAMFESEEQIQEARAQLGIGELATSIEAIQASVKQVAESMTALATRVEEQQKPAEDPKPEVPAEDVNTERVRALEAKLDAVSRELVLRDTMKVVEQTVDGMEGVSAAVRSRVIERFNGQEIPPTDIATRVTEAVAAEQAYALQIIKESGARTAVRGNGYSEPDVDTKLREAHRARVAEGLRQSGMSEEQVKAEMARA